jgi:hypothetical protein
MTKLSNENTALVRAVPRQVLGWLRYALALGDQKVRSPWRRLHRNTSIVPPKMVFEHVQDSELGELLTKYLLWDRKDAHRNSITSKSTGSVARSIIQSDSLACGLERR